MQTLKRNEANVGKIFANWISKHGQKTAPDQPAGIEKERERAREEQSVSIGKEQVSER